MPLVPCKCTNCGAILQMDSSKDAAVCEFCGSAFVVEKAINNYNLTNHITADVVNVYGVNYADFTIRAGVLEKYNGPAIDVVIPSNVTEIGGNAFEGCTSLKSVTIPNSVTIIQNAPTNKWGAISGGAFLGCVSLSKVIIPSSVSFIGKCAFMGCSNLVNISIPNSVTEIEELAFCGCTSLTSINIPNSVKKLGGYAFSGCSSLTNVVLPNGLTEIGFTEVTGGEQGAVFSNCTSLTRITIPNGVTKINNRTFLNCPALASVSIPNSVTKIGSFAFSGCSSLTSVSIPNSVSILGMGAFYGCTSLTSVILPNSLERIESGYSDRDNDRPGEDGNGTFERCVSLERIEIPENVTCIGDFAFWRCDNLTAVIIPDSVTEIGRGAFRDCPKLSESGIKMSSSMKRQFWNSFDCLKEPAKGGCYVATAVYGSYDCPTVWTLRRFRDQVLSATWYGRCFIRIYYAISPTLVKYCGNTKWFKRFWRKRLDKMVSRLKNQGVNDLPYQDNP